MVSSRRVLGVHGNMRIGYFQLLGEWPTSHLKQAARTEITIIIDRANRK
jgi:hypothetical protein